MKVKDIMTKEVIFVSPETKINKVADKLIEHRIHGVPVMKEDKLVGIITETDFFTKDSQNFYLPSYIDFIEGLKIESKASGENKKQLEMLMNASAKDIMTSECITVSPEVDINELFKIFKEKKLHLLPVVDKNNLLAGIVALADIIELIKI